ncbi:MAG: D-alanyl-D-alanine carboxypeptidase family protein [Oscillospiraceae bacterium]
MSQPSGSKPAKKTAPPQNGKRRATTSLVVLAVLLAVTLVCVFLLTLYLEGGAAAPSSSSGASSAPSAAPSSSQAAPAYVVPAVGPYDEEGIPLLANAENKLPEGYAPELGSIGNSQQMDVRAVEPFKAMQAAAAQEGVTLTPISGYRSNERQTNNYNSSIQRYLNQGYSKEESVRLTQQYYAIPGSSEHEAGLAVDINSLETVFENTKEFAWLKANCVTYGFILRYEKDAEPITGIAYEPWHYRYVGTNHAKAIQDLGITLEEYVVFLEENTAIA